MGVVKSTYGGGLPGTRYGGGIYEIDDGTGSMWVIANGNPPNKGAEVAVSGTFEIDQLERPQLRNRY